MSQPFLAEITMFAFSFAPKGWALCQGQLLPISQNTALFALLGTMYGGDGKSTFGLPDMQGNAPMFFGQGQGLSLYDEGASFDVILVDGEPAGRLYVHRGPSEIRIVDIALIPEHRGGGVGTSLLEDLLAEGDVGGKSVTIHVERMNPALRLYDRLGFTVAEDKGVYLFLERPPRAIR